MPRIWLLLVTFCAATALPGCVAYPVDSYGPPPGTYIHAPRPSGVYVGGGWGGHRGWHRGGRPSPLALGHWR